MDEDEKKVFDETYKKVYQEQRRKKVKKKAEEMAKEDAETLGGRKGVILKKVGKGLLKTGKVIGKGFVKGMEKYQEVGKKVNTDMIMPMPYDEFSKRRRKRK